MVEKSKILIIGGTGYLGKFIVKASTKHGHPTFLLVRESTLSNGSKSSMLESFKKSNVTFITGDLFDHKSLVNAIKHVDVVISAIGQANHIDQVNIIAAINEAGNVKALVKKNVFENTILEFSESMVGMDKVRKFYPSEFGNDVYRTHGVEPAKTAFAIKAQIRKAIENEGIPYAYITSSCCAGYFLPNLAQLGATTPPRDKVVIYGDGNAKVSLWKKKIGKTLEKVYMPKDQVLKNIAGFQERIFTNLSALLWVMIPILAAKLVSKYVAVDANALPISTLQYRFLLYTHYHMYLLSHFRTVPHTGAGSYGVILGVVTLWLNKHDNNSSTHALKKLIKKLQQQLHARFKEAATAVARMLYGGIKKKWKRKHLVQQRLHLFRLKDR
ncbi:isoflavone reductase [Artemisia annua]|uniref:Isoflavone reductase n=1 Tax=Artemisia annua TaxID=35608 RepID=A0A2U1NUC0_ARTAN|nr:isoflavone reductase [Artemisia annua]